MKQYLGGAGRSILQKTACLVTVQTILVFAVVFMMASAAFSQDVPQLPWHLKEWAYREVVEVRRFGPKLWGNTILAEFDAAPPLLAEDGRDVRVVDEKGRPVPYQWVNSQCKVETDPFGEGKRPLLNFEMTDPEINTYIIYFGNPQAQAETHEWKKVVPALMLETRVYPGGLVPTTWREMTALIARSNWKYGEGRRRQINDGENPYGPNEKFISIYRGMLNCPVAGEYGFATDSDDASFLLIDGMPVIVWPGGHPPSGKFDHYGEVKLTAAPHRIEYYHVQSGGGTLAQAGWRLPGAAQFEIIPEDAFIREVPTRLAAMERRDSDLNAFFVADIEHAIQFGPGGPVFTTVRFEDLTRSSLGHKVVAWQWDLGDGWASREQNPVHVYHGGERCDVVLKCIDDLGYESSWTRSISLTEKSPIFANIAMELTADRLIALPGEPVGAQLKFRNDANVPLEMTLVTEIRISPESVLKSGEENVTLEPGRWLTREVAAGGDHDAYFDTGEIAFRLEYRGEKVASRSIAVQAASDCKHMLDATQGKLVNDDGIDVVLRLSGQVGSRQGLSLVEKMNAGETVNIVVVDDTLLGSAPSNYLSDLADLLKKRFPRATINVSNFDPESGERRIDETLRGIVGVSEGLTSRNPDLVILPGSLRDVLRFTPGERFKRTFHAQIDRVRGCTDAEVLLLTPPPTIANPKLAQDYAMRIKELGMLCGLPVADAFSAFMMASGATVIEGDNADNPWRQYYRDLNSDSPMYYMAPAPQGQQLIAETLLTMICSEKPPK